MVFRKSASASLKNERVQFTVHPSMFDPEIIGSLTDSYVNLDNVLRSDMLYHYSGPIAALHWIALCQHPKYGHLDLVDMIDRNFPQIVPALRGDASNVKSLDFVSLGSGDGEIDIRILRHLEDSFDVRCYYCLDFSFELLRHAVFRVSSSQVLRKGFGIRAIWGDFLETGNLIPAEENSRLFALTGFTLGNYNETEMLNRIRALMTERDFLLVDARLHDLKDWDGRRPVSKQEMLHLLGNYSQDMTNRFVFGPVEAATMASAADVTFDCKINREMTSVPSALNVTLFCRDLRTKMRFSGETVGRDRLDLACTTFYDCADLEKWFPDAGFECVWEIQESNVALFLLKVPDNRLPKTTKKQ